MFASNCQAHSVINKIINNNVQTVVERKIFTDVANHELVQLRLNAIPGCLKARSVVTYSSHSIMLCCSHLCAMDNTAYFAPCQNAVMTSNDQQLYIGSKVKFAHVSIFKFHHQCCNNHFVVAFNAGWLDQCSTSTAQGTTFRNLQLYSCQVMCCIADMYSIQSYAGK